MSEDQRSRVDEVEKYYQPAAAIDGCTLVLFWLIAAISLIMPYAESLLGDTPHSVLQTFFPALVLIHFGLSLFGRLYLVPKAERMRRKQMLSDAFGTPLSHDHTSLYYNNTYSPSLRRLGAITLENSLFSKEISADMLITRRLLMAGYLTVWVVAFSCRQNSLALLTWITQLVFSGEIVAAWLKLECLRLRHESTYERLHDHFLHDRGDDEPRAIASILDAFAAYESAKSSAGLLLSTKVFERLNPSLTKKWEAIRSELGMDCQPEDGQGR